MQVSITHVQRQLTYVYIWADGIWNHVIPWFGNMRGKGDSGLTGQMYSQGTFVHNPFSWCEE